MKNYILSGFVAVLLGGCTTYTTSGYGTRVYSDGYASGDYYSSGYHDGRYYGGATAAAVIMTVVMMNAGTGIAGAKYAIMW